VSDTLSLAFESIAKGARWSPSGAEKTFPLGTQIDPEINAVYSNLLQEAFFQLGEATKDFFAA
jgi:hypothetical protein